MTESNQGDNRSRTSLGDFATYMLKQVPPNGVGHEISMDTTLLEIALSLPLCGGEVRIPVTVHDARNVQLRGDGSIDDCCIAVPWQDCEVWPSCPGGGWEGPIKLDSKVQIRRKDLKACVDGSVLGEEPASELTVNSIINTLTNALANWRGL
jgi:hypothetical protein